MTCSKEPQEELKLGHYGGDTASAYGAPPLPTEPPGVLATSYFHSVIV